MVNILWMHLVQWAQSLFEQLQIKLWVKVETCLQGSVRSMSASLAGDEQSKTDISRVILYSIDELHFQGLSVFSELLLYASGLVWSIYVDLFLDSFWKLFLLKPKWSQQDLWFLFHAFFCRVQWLQEFQFLAQWCHMAQDWHHSLSRAPTVCPS